ncbi:hypothetical protein J7T55_013934 [Diaporthe amygdali]|uniref:uncharacterized protein n=1 Tax=Phomopsis amygdali TaxID=1214568 RepID=UPI0022FEF9A0|nr:uncharacterized protein J7T55_013934 [Diaporthe amygdali]KAJ0119731.1 hypothetical protein J7T55_013934 [Diaporthe amygdali]
MTLGPIVALLELDITEAVGHRRQLPCFSEAVELSFPKVQPPPSSDQLAFLLSTTTISCKALSRKMSSPPHQAPAVLDPAPAAIVPLPASSPDSSDIVANTIDDTQAHLTIEADEAKDVLAPLPADTSTATGKAKSLTTISGDTDYAASTDKLSIEEKSNSSSTSTEDITSMAFDHSAPDSTTMTIVALPSQEPESVSDKADANEAIKLAEQQKAPSEDGTHSASPKTVATTNPNIDAADEGVEDMKTGSSQTLTDQPIENISNHSTTPEDKKFVDPNDLENIGNVIKFFYTSSTRTRPSSPVTSTPGCCNPRLSRDSDLYVKAKGEDGKVYVFEVVSTILEKASPKFEAMIYGSHKRGNREEWVWELEENPLGLKIMFCLLHNKFPRALVASKPVPSQLHTVLQVLDKYDVVLEDTNYHLFAPSWIDGFRDGLDKSKLTIFELLRVAHKMGDFKSTKILVREAAHEISDEVRKSLPDPTVLQQDILDSIGQIRHEDLKTLFDALRVPFDYLMDASNLHGKQYCKSAEGQFECNQKLLGSLLANLVQQALFPIPELAQYKGTVNALIDKFERMEIRGLFYPGIVMTEQRHTQCKLGQAAAVEAVLSKDDTRVLPLSDELVEYMYFACKRSGLLRKEQKEFEPYKDRLRDLDLLYRDEFKKDIWGWHDPEASEGDSSDDSGIF